MPVFKTVSPAGLAAALATASGRWGLNNSGSTIPQFSPCGWLGNGTLELASAAGMSADSFAGIASASIAQSAYGLVLRTGKIPGAVSSLNALSGQAVFLDETPGQFTLDTSGFAPTSAIIRVGFAEPPDYNAGMATDLTVDIALISQP